MMAVLRVMQVSCLCLLIWVGLLAETAATVVRGSWPLAPMVQHSRTTITTNG